MTRTIYTQDLTLSPNLAASLLTSAGSVKVEFQLLNPGEGVDIELVFTGRKAIPRIYARLELGTLIDETCRKREGSQAIFFLIAVLLLLILGVAVDIWLLLSV